MEQATRKKTRDASGADGIGRAVLKPKQIVKEGLSEYFIYTIEGTETIRNGWSKRMRSLRGGTRCRSRSSTATARPNTATSWCGCTC